MNILTLLKHQSKTYLRKKLIISILIIAIPLTILHYFYVSSNFFDIIGTTAITLLIIIGIAYFWTTSKDGLQDNGHIESRWTQSIFAFMIYNSIISLFACPISEPHSIIFSRLSANIVLIIPTIFIFYHMYAITSHIFIANAITQNYIEKLTTTSNNAPTDHYPDIKINVDNQPIMPIITSILVNFLISGGSIYFYTLFNQAYYAEMHDYTTSAIVYSVIILTITTLLLITNLIINIRLNHYRGLQLKHYNKKE